MIIISHLDVDLFLTESNMKISPGRNKLPDYIIFKHKLISNLIEKGKLKVEFENSDKKEVINYINNIKVTEEKNEEMQLNNKWNFSIKGQFYDYSGYAKVNRGIVSCLKDIYSVSIDPIDFDNMKLNSEDLYDISKIPISKEALIKVDSIVPSRTYASYGKYQKKILYTTVETNTVNSDICNIIDTYDEIWTTSNFCKASMLNSGIKKDITVVPGPIDISSYSEIKKASIKDQVKDFVFISVFNWNYRKAPEVLIRSYIKQFSDADDVSLLLVCRSDKPCNDPNSIRQKIDNIVLSEGKGNKTPHIARYSKPLSEDQLKSLYKACNVYVQPSRGEGYGLPYIEASMCGLPVISTKWGGQLDFLDENNSTLVEIDKLTKLENNKTGVYFWDSESMPYLLTDNFISRFGDAMRDCYNNYNKKLKMVSRVQEKIKKSHSENSIARILKSKYENL